jgi:hypothetical protein
LAILAEKSCARKVNTNAIVASSTTYKEEIAALHRRLDVYDQFVKVWEPKLLRWESLIEESYDAQFASDEGRGKGETEIKTTRNMIAKGKGPREKSTEEESQQSSSESGSDKSKSNSPSESDDEGEKGDEPAKEVMHPGGGAAVAQSSQQGVENEVAVTRRRQTPKWFLLAGKRRHQKLKRGSHRRWVWPGLKLMTLQRKTWKQSTEESR